MPNHFDDLDYVVVSDSLTGIVGAFQTKDMARMFATQLEVAVPHLDLDVIPTAQLDS
jgi:hypothetical protein